MVEVPMNKAEQEMVARALATMVQQFGADAGRTGTLKVLHSVRVGMRGVTPAEIAAGFLHDVLEDTPTAAQSLTWLPDDVFAAVCALTHRFYSRGESYPEFILRVKKAGPLAVKVKMNDILDNIARSEDLPDPAERLRQREKWGAALMVLR